MDRKYEFIDETITIDNHILRRIKAIETVGTVRVGDLGGFIESENNLSHTGTCWISNNACVYERAWVFADAQICGNAHVFGGSQISGDAQICGNAQIFGNSVIFGDAHIYGDARIYGNSEVFGYAEIFEGACVTGGVWIAGKPRIDSGIWNKVIKIGMTYYIISTTLKKIKTLTTLM